jgi:hypothetical protein
VQENQVAAGDPVATFMFIAANQACETRLVVADRRMRTIAPPIMIASHD